MEILRYNRRLVWVVIPLVLWALFGIAAAISAGGKGAEPPPFNVRVGLPEGGLWIPGHLLSVTETEEMLTLRIGVRPGDNPVIEHNHDNLLIEIEEIKPPPQPPQIQVLSEEVHYAGDSHGAALAENYLLKFDRWHTQVIPRSPELTVERFRQGIRQFVRERGQGRFGERRGPQGPGEGQPPPPPPEPGREGQKPGRGHNPRPPR